MSPQDGFAGKRKREEDEEPVYAKRTRFDDIASQRIRLAAKQSRKLDLPENISPHSSVFPHPEQSKDSFEGFTSWFDKEIEMVDSIPSKPIVIDLTASSDDSDLDGSVNELKRRKKHVKEAKSAKDRHRAASSNRQDPAFTGCLPAPIYKSHKRACKKSSATSSNPPEHSRPTGYPTPPDVGQEQTHWEDISHLPSFSDPEGGYITDDLSGPPINDDSNGAPKDFDRGPYHQNDQGYTLDDVWDYFRGARGDFDEGQSHQNDRGYAWADPAGSRPWDNFGGGYNGFDGQQPQSNDFHDPHINNDFNGRSRVIDGWLDELLNATSGLETPENLGQYEEQEYESAWPYEIEDVTDADDILDDLRIVRIWPDEIEEPGDGAV